MSIETKLSTLRQLMEKNGIDTYIITKLDPHQSEYAAAHWNGVQFICGFEGSAGMVVVTKNSAKFFTDSRYTVEAKLLFANGPMDFSDIASQYIDYAVQETPRGGTIGFDGRAMSALSADNILEKCATNDISTKTDIDLLEEFWNDRPEISQTPVYEHALEYCGTPRDEKLAKVRAQMAELNATHYVISSLDDICWLFNLRGGDTPITTTFYAFALITADSATLFADDKKIADVRTILQADNITISPYNAIYTHFIENNLSDAKVLVSPGKCCQNLYLAITKHSTVEKIDTDITAALKAIKNSTEMASIEAAHVQDGAAIVRLIKWIRENVATGNLTEYDICQKVETLRKMGNTFVKRSFDTIAGYNGNGAIVHYRPSEKSTATLKPSGMVLVDSGGNYYNGTTDITRTISLGEASSAMMEDYTLVLKSHISLAKAVFRKGTLAATVDMLARAPMWEYFKHYNHGTCHGVGFFLNVHESFGTSLKAGQGSVLEPGMVLTNEPGMYIENSHGIRLENIIIVIEAASNEFGEFFKFKNVTMCPFDLNLVIPTMLTDAERSWLNAYHKQVYTTLCPLLTEAEQKFLQHECREI